MRVPATPGGAIAFFVSLPSVASTIGKVSDAGALVAWLNCASRSTAPPLLDRRRRYQPRTRTSTTTTAVTMARLPFIPAQFLPENVTIYHSRARQLSDRGVL